MAIVKRNEIHFKHTFDRITKRHAINDIQSVFHCHHYTSLYSQLALDADETELLKECARESFHMVLEKYYADNPDIDTVQSRTEIGCQYYALLGMGTMEVIFMGIDSGVVDVPTSHTDEGWIKKWGKYDKPINYVTAGFIEALFECALGLEPKTFIATETQSIVMGAEISTFKVTRS